MNQTPELTDREFLANQYRGASNLNARIALHKRFSTNPRGWLQWVFDRLTLPADYRILEVGCGPGDLWRENADRIPRGWVITLSDISPGMLKQAQENLGATEREFHFETADAQRLPFPDAEFDAVIADHMLYHVPDRPRALAEFRRVLRTGGRLFASTVGAAHLCEIADLMRGFDPALTEWKAANRESGTFTLEDGGAQLEQVFSQVALRRYEDSLAVTEPAPLVDYILSGRLQWDGARRAELTEYVAREMERRGGVIRITKDTGLFEAVRD